MKTAFILSLIASLPLVAQQASPQANAPTPAPAPQAAVTPAPSSAPQVNTPAPAPAPQTVAPAPSPAPQIAKPDVSQPGINTPEGPKGKLGMNGPKGPKGKHRMKGPKGPKAMPGTGICTKGEPGIKAAKSSKGIPCMCGTSEGAKGRAAAVRLITCVSVMPRRPDCAQCASRHHHGFDSMQPRRPDCVKWAPRHRHGFNGMQARHRRDSKPEAPAFRVSQMSDAIFSKVDGNKDGVIDRAEFGKLVAIMAACHSRAGKMNKKPACPARPMAPAQPCPSMTCPR